MIVFDRFEGTREEDSVRNVSSCCKMAYFGRMKNRYGVSLRRMIVEFFIDVENILCCVLNKV